MLTQQLRMKFIGTIGKETYNKLCPEVKKIFIDEQFKKLNADNIAQFGSLKNYLYHYAKSKGFESYYLFIKDSIHKMGFKNQYEYIKMLAKRKGCKNPWRYRQPLRNRKDGITRSYQLINKSKRVVENGFKSFIEYENYLYRCKGFNDRAEYRRFLTFKKRFSSDYSSKEILEIMRKKEMYRLYLEINRVSLIHQSHKSRGKKNGT